MSEKKEPTAESKDSFASLFSDAKRVKTDKYIPTRAEKKQIIKKKRDEDSANDRKANASFEFSDGFEATFSEQGPLKYVKEGHRSDLVKMARRGEITPELILDLHGFNSQNAKPEIAALLFQAKKHHHQCVCIVHGVGSGILKRKIPSWLVQHPAVVGFHQAPLEWGGNGALLVLVEQDDINRKFD